MSFTVNITVALPIEIVQAIRNSTSVRESIQAHNDLTETAFPALVKAVETLPVNLAAADIHARSQPTQPDRPAQPVQPAQSTHRSRSTQYAQTGQSNWRTQTQLTQSAGPAQPTQPHRTPQYAQRHAHFAEPTPPPPPQQQLRSFAITIQTAMGAAHRISPVNPLTTIRCVKWLYENETTTHPTQQRLFFGGIELKDDWTLEGCTIEANSVLDLFYMRAPPAGY